MDYILYLKRYVYFRKYYKKLSINLFGFDNGSDVT